jgi:cytochrome c-type protein NapC
MDLSKQAPRAAEIHTRHLLSGEATCIECHKGIAYELPNMKASTRAERCRPKLQGDVLPQASVFDRLERFSRGHAMLDAPTSFRIGAVLAKD